MKINFSRFLVFIGMVCFLMGCVSVRDVSDEPPYDSMIGDSYIIQGSMGIYKSVCWEIGGLVLTPDGNYSDCFMGASLADVRYGDKFSVKKIVLRQFGSYGLCPQMVISVEGVNVGSEVFIPLCSSVRSISWLDVDLYSFARGDPITLKEEYAIKEN